MDRIKYFLVLFIFISCQNKITSPNEEPVYYYNILQSRGYGYKELDIQAGVEIEYYVAVNEIQNKTTAFFKIYPKEDIYSNVFIMSNECVTNIHRIEYFENITAVELFNVI